MWDGVDGDTGLAYFYVVFFLLAAEWPTSAGEVSASLLGPRAICLGSYFSRGDVWPFSA